MTVLLLGDITGRSRVALRMLSSVLEEKGHEVLMLPTALISNTLNLGMHEALDTTDYLMRSLAVWEKLGMRYDMAYMGYITGMEQARALAGVADRLRASGVRVVVDPILGDNGKKYNSVSQEQTEGMKLLCAHADLITPNLTEAYLLADIPYGEAQAAQLAQALAENGVSVLITSAVDSKGSEATLVCEGGKLAEIPFERVPGHKWGTGDLFTGLLIDGLLSGMPAEEAARNAGNHVAAQLRGEEKSLLPEQ
ncbi:MAG: bifunctional hydroxymethylpyrimidine kinase/phosphomethylpyrimidine kinase [Clostridia bacterium]|nr:bifunctional hydroxymethylpyrimidine kinase/phosphomethylpyrimidine kinase [Clostridia bacterium]